MVSGLWALREEPAVAGLRPYAEAMGFREHTGVTAEANAPVARVSTDQTAENASGGVHGGLIATLVDAAMGKAARLTTDDDAKVVTVQMSITYLNGAKPGDELVARAEVLKSSKNLALVTCEVHREGDDEHIAQAQATFAISHKD